MKPSFVRAATSSALLSVAGLPSGAPAEAQSVFHHVQAANLPTAETLPRGAWQFEISHRFDTPFSEGVDALWGLDGPVLNRLGLRYAATGSLLLGVLRSNLADNLELQAKLAVLEAEVAGLPAEVAVMGGVAWNTDPSVVDGTEDDEMQAYGQLVLNAMLGGHLAVGVVPTYLYNPRLRDVDPESTFSVGVNGQLYAADGISVLGEWIATEARAGLENDALSFGIELETRGHFFTLLLTNQARMNPTQHLGGSRVSFAPDEWRFGFNITRLLPL